MPQDSRSFSNTQIFVELGGFAVGSVNSAEFPTSSSLNMKFGRGMSNMFLSWIYNSLKNGTVMDGSVVSTDYAGNVVYWDDWLRGRVSQIVFPAVDATSSAALTISLSVQIASVAQSSSHTGHYGRILSPGQKGFNSNQFKVVIDGVDACKWVSKVDALTVGGIGSGISGSPEMTVTVRESHAANFRTWLSSGNSPRSGSFQYLGPDLHLVYDLSFQAVTINSISPAAPVSPVAPVTVRLQTSGFEFSAAKKHHS